MTFKTLPLGSIMITCPQLLGRLGNYLFNIAFCTKILYDLPDAPKKYLYFRSNGYANDGHGNFNIFNYTEREEADSYFQSIFKFGPVEGDAHDKNIESITCFPSDKLCLEGSKGGDKIFKHVCSRHRHVWAAASDCNQYELVTSYFPIIIEIYRCNDDIWIVHLNNALYEGIECMGDFTKNVYLPNDNITSGIISYIRDNIMAKNKYAYIFIKMDFAIISSHLAFHSGAFNQYFTKKLFGYHGGSEYAKDKYHRARKREGIYVSMHFRGGDYGIPERQTQHFAVLGPQYYIDCISDISRRHETENIYFVMFCAPGEDLRYIEKTFIPYIISKAGRRTAVNLISYRQFFDTTTGDKQEEINDQLTLYIMGLFDYMCLSNSTYSWWSSYFSPHYISDQGDRRRIYVPLLYQFPQDQKAYDNLYLRFDLEKGNNATHLILNNYIVNVLAWCGYSSSVHIYIMLKRYIDEFTQKHVLQLPIDQNIFKDFMHAIFRVLREHKLINLQENNLCEQKIENYFDGSCLVGGRKNRFELKKILQEILNLIFNDQTKIFTLINHMNSGGNRRYKFIKISEIMCTKDRRSDNKKYYKDPNNMDICDSIIHINTIDDTLLVGFLNEIT